MDTLWQDVRHAARRLVHAPGFTVVAVLVVALGIGANAAIFSVVNATLLARGPYPEPERLVRVWQSSPQRGEPIDPVPPAAFAAYRDEAGVFETLGAGRDAMYNLTGSGEPEALLAYRYSADLFKALGGTPVLGRTFTAEEDRPGHDGVTVLSYDLWQRRFAGEPNVLGRVLTLDGRPFTVVGVMPPDLLRGNVQLWTPLALDPAELGNHQQRYLRLVGRLKPGVTVEQASAAVARVARRLQGEHPDAYAGWTALAEPISQRIVGDLRPALKVLMAAVAFVLLIACANVANLLLVRAASREREAAVRVALGASRGRLVRASLAESLLVALLGGALGTWMAGAGVSLLLALFPPHLGNVAIPRLREIPFDARVFAFSLLLVVVSGVLFGLAPALRASATDPAECLREGGRTTAGAARTRLRNLLVAGELALALVLTSAAALMAHSFARLQSGRLGFEPQGVLTVRLTLPRDRYDADGQRRFMTALLEEARRVPGVEKAGTSTFLPLSGWGGTGTFAIEGRAPAAAGQEPAAHFRATSGDYFETLRVPLLRGRSFGPADGPRGAQVAVVNDAFARRYFPDGDVLGRRVDFRVRDDAPTPQWREIVGVVGDVRHYGLAEEVVPEIYLPFEQEPVYLFALAVRTTQDPRSLAGAVRQAVWNVDKDQPVSYVLTLDQMAAESTALQRTSTLTLLAFTIVALGLAALGLYGVLSYAVSQRAHEIGVRVALGAARSDILRMVMWQGLKLTAAGLGVGLLASLALNRLLAGLLYGVSPYDAPTLLAVVGVLVLAALLASFVPAFRATRVDPLDALRYE